MGKWIERVAIAAVAVFIVVVLIGIYAQWRDCTEAGGKSVRGLFGMECIK